jgi:hypothetical protein
MTPETADTAPYKSRPCAHVTVAAVCGATPTRRYLTGPRCADHTPAVLTGRANTNPDPALTLTGLRTAAGLPVDAAAPMVAGALIDERAVASGRRRSGQETFRAAREAEQARKDREKAARR